MICFVLHFEFAQMENLKMGWRTWYLETGYYCCNRIICDLKRRRLWIRCIIIIYTIYQLWFWWIMTTQLILCWHIVWIKLWNQLSSHVSGIDYLVVVFWLCYVSFVVDRKVLMTTNEIVGWCYWNGEKIACSSKRDETDLWLYFHSR